MFWIQLRLMWIRILDSNRKNWIRIQIQIWILNRIKVMKIYLRFTDFILTEEFLNYFSFFYFTYFHATWSIIHRYGHSWRSILSAIQIWMSKRFLVAVFGWYFPLRSRFLSVIRFILMRVLILDPSWKKRCGTKTGSGSRSN